METGEKKYKIKCCVPGCVARFSKRHRFPKDMELHQLWLNNISAPHIQAMPHDKLYNNYFVCNKHFAKQNMVPGTRRGLRKDAVPTLHLPSLTQLVDDIVETDTTQLSVQKETSTLPEQEISVQDEPEIAIVARTSKFASTVNDIEPTEYSKQDVSKTVSLSLHSSSATRWRM